ncbi:MAG TPA: hypothetical protein QGF58_21685 [Myxococcota bacterium]|nr:hypothetical protein [Myxococcota bacterium]
MADTLFVNPSRQLFYLVPAGTGLPDGAYLVVPLVPVPGKPRDVNRRAIEGFEIPAEEAKALLAERFDGLVGEARRLAEERDLPGGGAFRGLAGRFGRVLQSEQVISGLNLVGSALQDVATELRQRRESGEEPTVEPSDMIKDDDLALCGTCLTALDEETICPSCGADSAEIDPFRMTAAEFAAESWKTCASCGDELLSLASTCPECGAEQ